MSNVRVRFAPSPTGSVHIGNIRAAVFNWLFARHVGGKFLLRIEDTDLVRSTKEAIDKVLDAMAWLGLDYDEPVVYQTHNAADHLAAVERLLSSGAAYRAVKESVDPATGEKKSGEVVLFRMPKEGVIEYTDLVKGRMRKKAEDTQDFVIVRSDGSPVFHIANVVDDIKQGVTHIIRGDDHVENTFKHIQIFKALGAPVPEYAHLPMIVNAQGKPYSKRDGAAFVGEFKEQGYLPEALFNFLVLLGWAPGDDREVMSRSELVEAFSLDRVKSSPARFDLKKLLWMNGEYIAHQPAETFKAELSSRLAAAGLPAEPLGCTLDELVPPVQIRTTRRRSRSASAGPARRSTSSRSRTPSRPRRSSPSSRPRRSSAPRRTRSARTASPSGWARSCTRSAWRCPAARRARASSRCSRSSAATASCAASAPPPRSEPRNGGPPFPWSRFPPSPRASASA